MLDALTRWLTRIAIRWTHLFYELDRVGPPLPSGPVIVVANHPNSWIDALVLFLTAGRDVRPLARAPLFDIPGIGQVLRGLGGLPVYRPQDDPRLVERNESTFDAAVEALARGEAVLIFPEGHSHAEGLGPLKTGAARIAFRAAEKSDWRLQLSLVPVGLTYRRKGAFRGHAAAYVGEPLPLAPWRRRYEAHPVQAVQSLTAAIAEALEQVTLSGVDRDDEALIDAAEALYATERGLVESSEESLGRRLPRLKVFAEGLNWLRAEDPVRLARLSRAVRDYRRRVARLGIREGELPEQHPALRTLGSMGAQAILTGLELPLALLGIAAWWLPYLAPRLASLVHEPAHEARATIRLVTGVIVFPLVYAAWLVLAWRLGGGALLAAAAIVLPVAGFATLHWRRHWNEFRQELRFTLRSLPRHGLAKQLRARRAAIAIEMDRIATEWEAETGHRVRARPVDPD